MLDTCCLFYIFSTITPALIGLVRCMGNLLHGRPVFLHTLMFCDSFLKEMFEEAEYQATWSYYIKVSTGTSIVTRLKDVNAWVIMVYICCGSNW